jgi:hypothetical protein
MRATAKNGEKRRKVLDLSGKSKRQRSSAQIYSVLYYATKLKEPIRKAWVAQYLEDNPDSSPEMVPKMPLSFRNKQTMEHYAEESPEVIEEVEAMRANESKGKDKAEEVEEEDDDLDPEVAETKRLAKLDRYRWYATTTTSPSIHGCLIIFTQRPRITSWYCDRHASAGGGRNWPHRHGCLRWPRYHERR